MQALLGIMLPCLAKEKKARTERDGQIVNVVLHLFRNLAFIKDRPANRHASVDEAEYASLQSKYIKALSEAHVLDLLMTIASNATQDAFFNQWNTLVMEIFYLLFRGVSPSLLALDQEKACIPLCVYPPPVQLSYGRFSAFERQPHEIARSGK